MNQTRAHDLGPDVGPPELREARREAVDAILEAEELEAKARRARRRATAKNRHYENLLLEYEGQMRLPFEGGV